MIGFNPPPIPGLTTTGGLELFLQDGSRRQPGEARLGGAARGRGRQRAHRLGGRVHTSAPRGTTSTLSPGQRRNRPRAEARGAGRLREPGDPRQAHRHKELHRPARPYDDDMPEITCCGGRKRRSREAARQRRTTPEPEGGERGEDRDARRALNQSSAVSRQVFRRQSANAPSVNATIVGARTSPMPVRTRSNLRIHPRGPLSAPQHHCAFDHALRTPG